MSNFIKACLELEAQFLELKRANEEQEEVCEEICEEVCEEQEEEQEEEVIIGSFRGNPVYALDEMPFDKWDPWMHCHVHAVGRLADGSIVYEDELEEA